MLRKLSVKNYVLIDSLEIDFPEGLIIITGQTGAGKSIILGALSLLMGSKADASVITDGADSCVVEAEFDVEENSQIKAILDADDVEQDGGSIIVRRVVNKSGRSRSFVNDCPVTVQLLSEISSHLIDIHSQHQSLLLTDHRFQLSVLDAYAGNAALLEECRSAFAELNSLRAQLSEVNDRLQKLSAEKDFNEAQFRQLDAAALRDGELEELEAEQQQLANAEEIKGGLCQVESLFNPEQDSVLSLDAMLRESEHILSKLGRFVPEASELASRISSSRIELNDIAGDIASINSRMEVSADRLQIVEDRMSMLYELMKKHDCRSVAELIEVRERYSEALFDSSSLELRKDELEKAVKKADAALNDVAGSLHSSRVKAAAPFGESVCSSLHFLELERSVFSVDVTTAPLSATGADSVTFMFSATGSNPVDAAKCASGGELSRIMLSLKAMMAKFTEMPTMIFDEIDTGVSGSVADKMGTMICSMGNDMQVFAITHLPQVAAKGSAHFLVEKSIADDGRTVSTIRQLSDGERVTEVARMLSGSTITDAAMANARELLSL